jgi:hypothetical protein
VTIALSRIFRIALRLYEKRYGEDVPAITAANQPGADARATTAEQLGWYNLVHFFEDVFFTGNIRFPGPLLDRLKYIWMQLQINLGYFIMSVIYLFLFAGFQALGVLTANLQTDNFALSDDPECGMYRPTWNGSWNGTDYLDNTNITSLYEFDAETDSANWAHNCYNVQGTPDGCSYFYNQSIAYKVENSSCPFAPELCIGGSTSAVRFSTGGVSSRILGINSPKASSYEFNRTTICSPLNRNPHYVQAVDIQQTNVTYQYFYGWTDVWPGATWQSRRHMDRGDYPGYLVK